MPQTTTKSININWCTYFVRSLYAQGIRDVVISPGSRSTPLTLAFSHHAGFTQYVNIDERSAGFFALGIAKATGIPAVLVCTSGTALANYHPVVMEARQSGTPLIVVSADRPTPLRQVGASQTMDQTKFFGDHVGFFHDMGAPDSDEHAIRRMKFAAVQAVTHSIQECYPVHLNFPFSKPLEPTPEELEEITTENDRLLENESSAPVSTHASTVQLPTKLWERMGSSNKPLLIVGPSNTSDELDAVLPLAAILSAPVLAEPGANVGVSDSLISGFDGFLKNPKHRKQLRPDLILRFGRQPVSKALNLLLEEAVDVNQIGFQHPALYANQEGGVDHHVRLTGKLEVKDIDSSTDNSWFEQWQTMEQSFTDYRSERVESKTPLTDGQVFHELSKHLPVQAFTMLSNSFPVRDFSLFGHPKGKEVFVNRGVAGIDGILSTAMGLSVAKKTPGVLFVGDIAFLHDSNALLVHKQITSPLVIVLLNNGGGTIFRMLPIAEHKPVYETYFETPQDVSFAALCRGFKVNHTLVSRPEYLASTFSSLIEQPGVHVMECITDAESSMKERELLWSFTSSLSES